MLIGVIALSVSAGVCFLKSYDPVQVIFAVLFLCIGLYRYFDATIFDLIANLAAGRGEVRRWENRYFWGTSAFSVLLGAWAFASLAFNEDTIIHLVCTVAILACIIGVYGRNFARRKLVDVQILLIGVPLGVGFLTTGISYYYYLAFGLIPFLSGLRQMAARQRNALFNALISEKETSVIASEFDAAITNMPLGLCMFADDGSLVVSNPTMNVLFPQFRKLQNEDLTSRALLSRCLQSVDVTSSEIDNALAAFDDLKTRAVRGRFKIKLPGSRTIEVDYQPKLEGGSVVVFEDTTEREKAERKIRYMARFDALTELPNRAYFLQQMEEALADEENTSHSAVLILDLDAFKQVNDTLGHAVGDEVLRDVSRKLSRIVDGSGLACRFGGDEFVVMLPNTEGRDTAHTIASRIVAAINRPVKVGNHHIEIGVSVGIAFATPQTRDPARLIQNADLALYRAKANPDSRICFFKTEMEESFHMRLRLETELRRAIADGLLTVAYQPIIDLTTNRIAACEALVRWTHAEMGPISPGVFIPIAESTGMIDDLGQFVLEAACSRCIEWPDDVAVSVNLSAVQLRRYDVVASVKQALEKTGLPAERLHLEVTETAALEDMESTCRILSELRELGSKISLDDFGTGYSSLNYLNRLPIDKLKVDRSFVSDITDKRECLVLMRGVARLAQDLGLVVVIEGVETQEQMELLACEMPSLEVQGFLFGLPLPADGIAELLEHHRITAVPRRLEVVS